MVTIAVTVTVTAVAVWLDTLQCLPADVKQSINQSPNCSFCLKGDNQNTQGKPRPQRTLWAVWCLLSSKNRSTQHLVEADPLPSGKADYFSYPESGTLSRVLDFYLFIPLDQTSGSKLWSSRLSPSSELGCISSEMTHGGWPGVLKIDHKPQNLWTMCRAIVQHQPAFISLTTVSSGWPDPAREGFWERKVIVDQQQMRLTPSWKVTFPPRWYGYSMGSKTEGPFWGCESTSQHKGTSFWKPALCCFGRESFPQAPLQHPVYYTSSAVTWSTPTYFCFSESSNSFSVLLLSLWDEERPRDTASFTSLIASSGQLVCLAQFKNSSITCSLQKQRQRVTVHRAPGEMAINLQQVL